MLDRTKFVRRSVENISKSRQTIDRTAPGCVQARLFTLIAHNFGVGARKPGDESEFCSVISVCTNRSNKIVPVKHKKGKKKGWFCGGAQCSVYLHASSGCFHFVCQISFLLAPETKCSSPLFVPFWRGILSHVGGSVLKSFPLQSILLSTNTISNLLVVPVSVQVSLFLDLDGLEIYPGVYRVQLAVQGVKGGSLGGLGGPAVHHDAVNILRAARWTGQPEP